MTDVTGWWAETYDGFDIDTPISVGMETGGIAYPAAAGIGVPIGIGMTVDAHRYTDSFGLALPIGIGAAGVPPTVPGGEFGLTVPPGVTVAGAMRGNGAFGIGTAPTVVVSGGRVYPLGLSVPPSLSFAGGAHHTEDFLSYPGGYPTSTKPSLWAGGFGLAVVTQDQGLSGDAVVIYALPLLTDDYEVSATVNSDRRPGDVIYLCARANLTGTAPGAAGPATGAHMHAMVDSYNTTGYTDYVIQRQGAGNWVWHNSNNLVRNSLAVGSGGNYVVGDKFSFRAQGNVYTVLKNGVAQTSWTDAGNTHPIGAGYRHVAVGAYRVNLGSFEAKDI